MKNYIGIAIALVALGISIWGVTSGPGWEDAGTESASTLNKSTGDTVTPVDFAALDTDITDNHTRLTTVEGYFATASTMEAAMSAGAYFSDIAAATSEANFKSITNLEAGTDFLAPNGSAASLTGLPISTGVSGLGGNVATALAIAVGQTGAPVVFDGAVGTPTQIVLTNGTGLPAAAVVVTPAGDIAATNAGTALNELDDEKATLAGDTPTGVWNFGGATSVEIPNGTDPDVTIAGQISNDTDGANVAGDVIIRAFDGTNQWPIGQKLVHITFPFTTAGAVTTWQPWTNETGMTFTLLRIFCRSDTDDLTIDIDEFTSIINLTILNVIADVTVDTDGTGVFYKTTAAGSMTDTEIETQHGVSFDIGAAAEGFVTLEGWFNANVD